MHSAPLDTHQQPSAVTWKWLLYVLLPPLLYFGCSTARNSHFLLHGCEQGADYQIISLGVEMAKRCDSLTGAYSRFGFRHPGPVYFYYYAAVEPLLQFIPAHHARHLIAQTILNLFVVIVAGHLLYRHSASRMVIISFYFSFAFVNSSLKIVHGIWNPFVTVVPAIFLLVLSSRTSLGNMALLPLQLLTSAVLVQAHLGTALFAATILLVSIVQGTRTSGFRLRGRPSCSQIAAIFALLIVNLPPLWEALTQETYGNVGAIIQFLGTQHAHHPLSEVGPFLSLFFTQHLGILSRSHRLLAFLVLLVIPYVLPPSSPHLLKIRFLSLLGIVAAFVSCKLAAGQLISHMVAYTSALVIIWYFLIFAGVAERAVRYCVNGQYRWHSLVAPTTIIVAVSIMVAVLLPPRLPRKVPQCEAISKIFLAQLKLDQSTRYHLVAGDDRSWPFLAGIGLRLVRTRHEICVDDKWWFTFDRSLTCSYRRQRDVKRGISTAERQLVFFTVGSLTRSLEPNEFFFKGVIMRWY